jgi:predicted PurR-regulated permease PerM
MGFIIGIIILTSFTLILSKYLKYNRKLTFSKIIIVIIFFNLIFYGGIVIIGTINNIKNEIDFNNNIQLYGKDHPDYGLLKNYDSLTDKEKQIHDYYIGDGGKKMFTYILVPILFILNIVFIIILYFLMDQIYKLVSNRR